MHDDRSKTPPTTPPQLWVGIGLAVVLAIALVWLGFSALPSLKPEHQAFWSGLVGSFVGSAVAFAGAAWMWRMERHILVDERTADRFDMRLEERKRDDARSLRDCLSISASLRALTYRLHNERRFAAARDKYHLEIRFNGAVSLINDDALRGELEFISKLIDDDQGLDAFVQPEWLRLKGVHEWLLRLISLSETGQPTDARPENYDQLGAKLDSYDAYREEESRALAEYEEARKAAAKSQRPATAGSESEGEVVAEL